MDTFMHHCRLLSILSLVVALIVLVAQAPVHGQATAATHTLSTMTATEGVVKDVRIAGNRIVYLVVDDAEERYDLHSVPLAGGTPLRLTAGLVAGEMASFETTSTGRVVFSYRHDEDGRRYLYSVPAAGGALTRLGPIYPASPPPMTGSQLVFGLAGERVVFAVDARVPNGFELYSVPAAGGPAVRLSPELPPVAVMYPAPFWVTAFAIDDGTGLHVAISVRQGPVPQGSGLYAVPADGSVPPTLIGGGADKLDLTPDGRRVVYTLGTELRTVDFAGGNDSLIDTGWSIPFAITPDSARVVYALDTTIKSFLLASGTSTPVATDVRYAATLTFQLTPDGAGVLYNDSASTALLLAPVTGGITQTVIAEPVGPAGVRFSGDGARAIFGSWSSGAAIYSYLLPGGPLVRIDDPSTTAAGITELLVAPAGAQVVYGAGPASVGPIRLFSVPASGGAAVPLTSDLGPDQERIALQTIGPDGTVLFIAGNSITSGPTRWRWLYAVPADGSATPRLVNTPSTDGFTLFLPLLRQ